MTLTATVLDSAIADDLVCRGSGPGVLAGFRPGLSRGSHQLPLTKKR
jgi:hypothetical protein